MIKTNEAKKAVAYHLFCDICGTEMESTYLMLTCDPPRYEHKCPKCNNKDYTRKQYPYIAFEWEERRESCHTNTNPAEREPANGYGVMAARMLE